MKLYNRHDVETAMFKKEDIKDTNTNKFFDAVDIVCMNCHYLSEKIAINVLYGKLVVRQNKNRGK